MTQEDKELLLKDLSARLPYGIKCQIQEEDEDIYIGTLYIIEIDDKNGHLLDFSEQISGLNCQVYLSEVKPYLFPFSSMTEEQKKEYIDLLQIGPATGVDWLNKNKFDYRCLIPKGLAIDASELNIY